MIVRPPQSFAKSSDGFTLIEVLVAIVIVSIVMAVLVFGFDQAETKRRDSAAMEMLQWLKASEDISVFQSTVLGIAQQDKQLLLMGFYQNGWYRLADQESFIPSEEIALLWSESLLRTTDFQLDSDEFLNPYVVMMPTGEIFPEGQIDLFDNQDNPLASISWEEGEFQLEWVED